jgi:large subunit ribosomal protein L18
MERQKAKAQRRARRQVRVRKVVVGTPVRPRICVYRSLHHIYAQLIDDMAGKTLVSASSVEKEISGAGGNRAAAEAVGKTLASRAKAAGIEKVVFDRNGFIFHGRVKALAEGARAGGLKF